MLARKSASILTLQLTLLQPLDDSLPALIDAVIEVDADDSDDVDSIRDTRGLDTDSSGSADDRSGR